MLQYINGYEGGLAGFVARAASWPRSTASASSRRPRWSSKAERGETYSDAPALATA